MLLAVLFIAHSALAAPACSPLMFASCDRFAALPINLNGSKELNLPLLPKPTMIYNSLAGTLARKNAPPPKDTEEMRKNTAALGLRAIAAAKEVVTGGIDPAYLTTEQKAMLARLDSVRVVVLKNSDPDCKTSKKEVSGAPDATYAEEKHTLQICPGAAALAPSALLLILTHEIGHAISPCVMTKDHYLIHPEHYSGCKLNREDRTFVNETFKGLTSTFLAAGRGLYPELAGLVKKLEACGVLEAQPQANYHGKPELYEKLSACLEQRYRGEWKKLVQKNHYDEVDLAPGGEGNQRCISVVDEHFADAFGARVFGKILAQEKDPATFARVAMIMPATDFCASKGAREPGDYPHESVRFDLHLGAPATQKALGCVATSPKICGMTDFLVYPKVPGPGAGGAAAGSGASAN